MRTRGHRGKHKAAAVRRRGLHTSTPHRDLGIAQGTPTGAVNAPAHHARSAQHVNGETRGIPTTVRRHHDAFATDPPGVQIAQHDPQLGGQQLGNSGRIGAAPRAHLHIVVGWHSAQYIHPRRVGARLNRLHLALHREPIHAQRLPLGLHRADARCSRLFSIAQHAAQIPNSARGALRAAHLRHQRTSRRDSQRDALVVRAHTGPARELLNTQRIKARVIHHHGVVARLQ